MEQTTRRTLASILIGVFLLAACAPAQAVTQESAINQELNEISAGLTASAKTAQAIDQRLDEQSSDLEAAAQITQTAEQQTSTPSVISPSTSSQTPTPNETATHWQQTIDAELTEQFRQATQAQWQMTVDAGVTADALQTQVAQEVATATPTGALASLQTLTSFLSSGAEQFDPCTYIITPKGGKSRELTVARNPRLDLEAGDRIIIIRPVNLRTGPSLSNRILMTLRTDPTYNPTSTPRPNVTPNPMITPDPTATLDLNRIAYTIIGGPGYSNLSADDAPSGLDGGDALVEYSPYTVSGRKYIWWQILSPDRETTGWIVESSACGLHYFIEEVPQEVSQ